MSHLVTTDDEPIQYQRLEKVTLHKQVEKQKEENPTKDDDNNKKGKEENWITPDNNQKDPKIKNLTESRKLSTRRQKTDKNKPSTANERKGNKPPKKAKNKRALS